MKPCVFCQIVARQASAYIVYEDKDTLAFLDKHPQTRGHIQLVPKKHYQWVYEIPRIGNFFVCAKNIIRAIIPVLNANHATLATFGRQVEHAHLWIVPQYSIEQEFSESSIGTAFESESPQELAQLLRRAISGGGV